MDSANGFRWSDKKNPLNNSWVKNNVNSNSLLLLNPLMIWMRFLGIELDPFQSSKFYRRAIFTYGLILLISNILCNPLVAIREVRHYSKIDSHQEMSFNQSRLLNNSTKSRQLTSTFTWSMIIDYTSYGLLAIGVHCWLFVITKQSKWKLLWNNLQQILEGHQEFQALRKDIKRLAIIGLSCIFMEIFWLQIIMLWHDPYMIDILSFLLRFLSNWYQVYATSGLIIFALIGWALVLGFRSLGNQLDNILQTTQNNTLVIDDLFKWKELHVLLCVTVDEINNCLGPLLLFWISHVFVSFISIPFYLLEGLRDSNTNPAMLVTNFGLLFELLVHLLILTGIPSRIWHEAVNMGKRLQQANIQDIQCQEQVDFLATEVFLSLPKITALDYCDLDLSLIPTLVGTTLTYLIILCQFQSSEESAP